MNPAKRYLQQIQKFDALIEIQMKKSALWKSRALSTTSPAMGDKVKSSGDQQKMASALNKAIDAERKADWYIDQKYECIEVIESLDDADKIMLLYKIYVDGKTLQEVADEDPKGRGYSWARGLHGRALNDVLAIINQQRKEDAE